MKIVLDIKDSKADFFVELMKRYDFIEDNQQLLDENENDPSKSAFAKDHILKIKQTAKGQFSKRLKNKTEFQAFLEKGPVMDDSQYAEFKAMRKRFNEWRQK